MDIYNEYPRLRKKRSLKSDPLSRDFICGCGKTYLSYPALFTHVKHKHDGIFPPGSTKIKNNEGGMNRFNQLKQKSSANFSKEFIAYL